MNTPPKVIVTRPPVGTQQANTNLSARTPLLLLPVHIQTRFVKQGTVDRDKGSTQLWVRIYPDQIAVDSHEPELTNQEISDGQAYWNAVWQAGNPPPDPDDDKAPWRMIASLYTPQRAAWICSQLAPTNLAQQPAAPTPAGTTPVPAPIFPVVPIRNSSWEQPAVADALPDAWTVVLISGGQTSLFRGSPITQPLAVSLTPNSGAFPPGSVVDANLQWMVDFTTALQAGMALKIPLTVQQSTSGIDQIFVYGLRASDPQPSQTLANLLNAHHYTDGLALVPQGAPTNNTPDASAAYSRKDPNYEISYETERSLPLTSNQNCDGVNLANLVGIPSSTFDHVQYADGTDALDGTDMLRALWPATLGYFLNQIMASVFSTDAIEQGREYVLANTFPRGPIAALRVGRTPYGILPVTSLRNYRVKPDVAGPVETGLVNFVQKLWPTWLSSSANAPRMQSGSDPDQSLMSILGMDASSMTFQGRPVMGGALLWNLLSFFGLSLPFEQAWWGNFSIAGLNLLKQYGYTGWAPWVVFAGFDPNSFPITFSTVQDGPLSETSPLNADANLGAGQTGNYINWLQTASIADIQAENYPGTKPTSLLYKILRQSMLLLYATLAGNSEVNAGRLTVAQIQENQLVDIKPGTTNLTPWQVLSRPSVPNAHVTWADYLLTPSFPANSPFAQLNDVRASLGRLAALPTAELDRLLTETLDACSHRLDVWATTIATSLLNRTRPRNTSVYLGCYGWVENVRPETGRVAVQGTELQQVQGLDAARAVKSPVPTPLPVPLQPLTDNGGYIFAPSQTQAAVAAVLRNGYMTHKDTAEEGLLAIDLSSERVQKALWLISGVQQGQSLNALLGYLFEDALNDQNLNQYVQPFRNAYPLVGNKLTPSSAPAESVAASDIVDGVALRAAWDTGKLVAGQNWGAGLPAPGAEQNSVIAILKMLDDYADALGDLSISEAVFQAVRGNFGHGGGLMDAISRGSRPPTPKVVDTPRGGIDLTHRVALLLAGTPTPNPSWSAITQHPRAAAEPWLDAWVGQMLPDPATVRGAVQYKDQAGNGHSTTVRLSDLNVGPLDVLSMSDAAEVPQQSELENRILYKASVPAGLQNVQIVFQPSSLPAGSIAFPDALYVAQKLRSLLGAARALTPQDMNTPETSVTQAAGVELQNRVTAAVTSLKNDIGTLTTAQGGLPGTPDPVRAALLECSLYGVTGSIPTSTSGPDPNLATQATNVLSVLQARYKSASALNVASAQVSDLVSALHTIFGNDFVVLPQFSPQNLTTLQAAFGQSAALTASDTQAPVRWFRQLTHVRAGVSRLDMALSAVQALSGSAVYPPSLLLGQIPPPPTGPDRWLALPLDPTNLPQKGRVAFACVTQGDPTTQNTYAGLMVDEWPERIPETQQNAAVAFHFEEPSARAPQALLLAVCPDNRETWDDPILQAVLAETLELAKIRTVDLASVQQVGPILPALYFALNLQGATVSTQFAILQEVTISAA